MLVRCALAAIQKDPDSIDNTPMRTARSKKLRRYRPPLAAAAATRRMASEEIPERRKKSFLPNAEKETEDDKNPLMEELDVEPEFDVRAVTPVIRIPVWLELRTSTVAKRKTILC